MAGMEQLVELGKGTINRDVTLHVISIDLDHPNSELKSESRNTHIFFPSRSVLDANYYSSGLSRQEHPEFRSRLLRGAHQLHMCYFAEEALARYFDHPEMNSIDDSLAGGSILIQSSTPDDRYIYVRYGKCALKAGQTCVTAIYKDLGHMAKREQRHWHTYEIRSSEVDLDDPMFNRFLRRTYEGKCADYPDPIRRISEAMRAVNSAVPNMTMFRHTSNPNLRLPVEQTPRSFCSSCSELFKLIGPDSLRKSELENYLQQELNVNEEELLHHQSKRALGSMHLLKKLETGITGRHLLFSAIEEVGSYRQKQNHSPKYPTVESDDYVAEFVCHCERLCVYLGRLAERLVAGCP
jgi:hypothetical protein